MAIDKASLTTKKDRQSNTQTVKQQKKMLEKAQYLAKKYYKTSDLKALTPRQLDKVVTWATNCSPDAGKNRSRKAEMALRTNKKYQKDRTRLYNKEQGSKLIG